MPSLSEVQRRLRDTIVADAAALPPLVGGRHPDKRVAVHRRHYEASLTTALLDKFPAVTWLTGASFMTEAARAFVHRHPPTAPCIAEYGASFPAFIAGRAGAERIPYLRAFAELEWHIGRAAISIDSPSLAIEAFSTIGEGALPDVVLRLQPGLNYCRAAWPIDDLISLYLSGHAPERYVFEPADVHLVIRGARGDFRMERVGQAAFLFRRAVAQGRTLGDAAGLALEADADFDAGRAFAALIADGLVVAITQSALGADT